MQPQTKAVPKTNVVVPRMPLKFAYPKIDSLTGPKTLGRVLKMKISELWFRSQDAEREGNPRLAADCMAVHDWAAWRLHAIVNSRVPPEKTGDEMRVVIGVIDKSLERLAR